MAVFGKTWTFSFTARDGEKTVPVYSLEGARAYADAPTNSELSDVGNSLATSEVTEVTSWADGPNDHEKLITFASITDPDAYSQNRYEIYYVVVNYKYESGGDTAHSCKKVLMYRPDALTSRFGVVIEDVLSIESKFEHMGSQWIAEKLLLAEELVERDIVSEGMELRRVVLEDANNLVMYRAAAIGSNDLSSDSGDIWDDKYRRHMETYDKLFKYSRMRYDFDNSGVATPDEKKSVSFVMFGRG